MLETFAGDIMNNDIVQFEQSLLNILLFDRSTRKNIIWATEDYSNLGEAYQKESEILLELITGERSMLIQPRTRKTFDSQQNRVREKAEVFTPSWICNEQNNLIDNAWFGRQGIFNFASGTTWITTYDPVPFPKKGMHTWKRYVDAKRMEISCGEAPYLVSRYDATTGEEILITARIGLLDRKLRVVNENTNSKSDWLTWAVRAVQSVYGFEFQGDSLLLARQNVFLSFLEYYNDRYHELPEKKVMSLVARIISWNLWQMDGMKYVAPYSCKPKVWQEMTLFGDVQHEEPCPGCKYGDHAKHTGVYCKIMDWRDNQSFRYVDLMKGDGKR